MNNSNNSVGTKMGIKSIYVLATELWSLKSGTCIRDKGVKEEYLTIQSFYQLQLRNGSDSISFHLEKGFLF